MTDVQNYNYELRLKILNQNGVELYKYPNLNITSYIGSLVYSARLSGVTSSCPDINTTYTTQGFNMKMNADYTSNKEIIP